jgi:hypothetical protein
MRQQWEKAISRVEQEAPRIREQRSGARQRIEQRVSDRTQQAQGSPSTGSSRPPQP